MTEKPSLPEQEPDLERKVIEMLRTRSPRDPETRTLLNELIAKKESECGPDIDDQLKLDLWRSRLYESAGFLGYALEILEDLAKNIGDSGSEEVRRKILEQLGRVRNIYFSKV